MPARLPPATTKVPDCRCCYYILLLPTSGSLTARPPRSLARPPAFSFPNQTVRTATELILILILNLIFDLNLNQPQPRPYSRITFPPHPPSPTQQKAPSDGACARGNPLERVNPPSAVQSSTAPLDLTLRCRIHSRHSHSTRAPGVDVKLETLQHDPPICNQRLWGSSAFRLRRRFLHNHIHQHPASDHQPQLPAGPICCISSSTASTTHTSAAPSEVQHYLLKDGGRNYQVRIVHPILHTYIHTYTRTHTHARYPRGSRSRDTVAPAGVRLWLWSCAACAILGHPPYHTKACCCAPRPQVSVSMRMSKQSGVRNSRASGLLLIGIALQMRCRW